MLKGFPFLDKKGRGYSGGPAPDSNGIPYQAPEGTIALLCESTCWCQGERL